MRLTKKIANQEKEKRGVKGVETWFIYIDLIIYNLLGEEVTRLAMNEYRPAGYYNFIWNGRNAMGTKVSTGVYFYHAMVRNAQGKTVLNKTKKMIFLK